jgi:hypothetical protein
MSGADSQRNKKLLLRDRAIAGIAACLLVLFACIRIFALDHASIDSNAYANLVLMNIMSVSGAVLSLVVFSSAVRIMLQTKKATTFQKALAEKCREIDYNYGALIIAKDAYKGDDIDGAVYLIANDLDSVFFPNPERWDPSDYKEKFAFSKNFTQEREIYYYVNHANMTARSVRTKDDLPTTARLLARDTAVAIQRAFPNILTAHALELTQEEGRAVVTIHIQSAETVEDAEHIAELIDYMLFLHFVAT